MSQNTSSKKYLIIESFSLELYSKKFDYLKENFLKQRRSPVMTPLCNIEITNDYSHESFTESALTN